MKRTFLWNISIALFLTILLSVSSLAYYTPFYRDQTNVQYVYPGYSGNEWYSGYGYARASYGYYPTSAYSYGYGYYPRYYASYPVYYRSYTPYYYTYAPNYYYYTYDTRYPYNYQVTTGTFYYNPSYNSGQTFYLVG